MEVFIIQKEDINERLDCFYYRPHFTDLENKIGALTDKTLGNYILEIAGGATPKIEESEKYYTDDPAVGIPFLRVQNVSPEGLKLDDVKHITPLAHNKLLKRSQVNENNLIIKITGVGRMAVSSVAPKDFRGNINQHLVVIQTKDYETSTVLATFLNTDIGEQLSKRRTTGGTRPALDYQALKSIPIIYKPEIVKIMDDAYSKTGKNKKRAEKLLNSYSKIINEFVDIKLNAPIQRKIFSHYFNELEGAINSERYASKISLDSNHSWIKIKDIGEVIRETITPSRSAPENNYGLIRIDDLENNPQDPEIRDVQGNKVSGIFLKVKENDILLARLGPTLENKKTIIVPGYEREVIASNEFICLRCKKNVNHVFILIVLKTNFYKNLMIQKSRGSTPSRRRLSHEDFAELPFPLIEKNIQDEIAYNFIANIIKAKNLKEEAIDALQKAKEGIEKLLFE